MRDVKTLLLTFDNQHKDGASTTPLASVSNPNTSTYHDIVLAASKAADMAWTAVQEVGNTTQNLTLEQILVPKFGLCRQLTDFDPTEPVTIRHMQYVNVQLKA